MKIRSLSMLLVYAFLLCITVSPFAETETATATLLEYMNTSLTGDRSSHANTDGAHTGIPDPSNADIPNTVPDAKKNPVTVEYLILMLAAAVFSRLPSHTPRAKAGNKPGTRKVVFFEYHTGTYSLLLMKSCKLPAPHHHLP
jgi:hypothetical protein